MTKHIFTVVAEYCNEEDFGGDPRSYLVLLDGTEITHYGDDYHDKGGDKCDAFIEGYVKGKNIKDYDTKYENRVQEDTEES